MGIVDELIKHFKNCRYEVFYVCVCVCVCYTTATSTNTTTYTTYTLYDLFKPGLADSLSPVPKWQQVS